MASNLRVDNIQPTTGTGIGIGTANGSVTFNADVTGGMNITTGSLGVGINNTTTTGFSRTIRVKGSSTSSGVSGLFAESYAGSAWFGFYSGSSTTDTPALLYPYNGALRIGTTNSVGTSGFAERLRLTSAGNLKFVTPGTGIDFSATSDGGTSTPSELLDDYEEGSWDPQILGWNGSYSIQEGRYIKIGRMVHILGEVRSDANVGNSFTNSWPGLSNLPFVNTTSFQGVSGSQRCMGYGTILGDISPGGTNGQGFVTFDRNTGNNAFFPNHISSQGAQNFQNTMINNPTTVDFGYRFNCTYYTD